MRLSTEEIISEYWQSIYAVAFNVCKNQMDAEDVAQDTFVKYHMHNKQFDNKEHLRAWLIKVTINAAKNNIKSFWRKNKISFEEYIENEDDMDDFGQNYEKKELSIQLTKAVLSLSEKYRLVIHLYYYEEYSCGEISKILRISESAVRKRLCRGRDMLKNMLTEELNDD